ncbi:HNH endonuclease [Pontibacterium sp. N1Y112]|uniref:HNH endonuclease n=1 Tax=Pontibacterium sinense TaxID=2781979 RepID=A0A8J7FF38_9GAMM|nr:HNH endonuclease signature motif containing protein [Pontibacterium sinense]MBE9398254.1 HNH endonuclease [Pontibacterium sinense]
MFEPGREYRRRSEIHALYNGQQQGGISCPKDHPYIFIFSSNTGKDYGYKDEFHDDIFWYTGMGQTGDMKMISGNREIRDHAENGKTIFVFEQTRKSYVRFIGKGEYLGHHEETRPDKDGMDRKAFIFHLDIDSSPNSNTVEEHAPSYATPDIKAFPKLSLSQLRDLAVRTSLIPNSEKEKTHIARRRSAALKIYVQKRAEGKCEGCGSDAPFLSSKGPFLECHHLHRLADGGPDHPQNVVALCPNCHRKAHYSKDAQSFNEKLKTVALRKEPR